MKKLLLSLLIVTAVQLQAQTKCADFKTGKFQNIENGFVQSKIERNETIQIEQNGAKEIKLKVTWIDDCNYRLEFLEGNAAFWKSRPKGEPTPDLLVRITKTDEFSYMQEAKFANEEEYTYRSKIVRAD